MPSRPHSTRVIPLPSPQAPLELRNPPDPHPAPLFPSAPSPTGYVYLNRVQAPVNLLSVMTSVLVGVHRLALYSLLAASEVAGPAREVLRGLLARELHEFRVQWDVMLYGSNDTLAGLDRRFGRIDVGATFLSVRGCGEARLVRQFSSVGVSVVRRVCALMSPPTSVQATGHRRARASSCECCPRLTVRSDARHPPLQGGADYTLYRTPNCMYGGEFSCPAPDSPFYAVSANVCDPGCCLWGAHTARTSGVSQQRGVSHTNPTAIPLLLPRPPTAACRTWWTGWWRTWRGCWRSRWRWPTSTAHAWRTS